MSLTSVQSLDDQELEVRGKSHLHELENAWLQALNHIEEGHKEESRYLAHFNRFRLRNLSSLKEKRPAILLGFINDLYFPNFHTLGLLRVADIVSLTSNEEEATGTPDTIDRLYYQLVGQSMTDICKLLPRGFKPALYWDMQAAHGHVHPMGMSRASFPLVASVCHVQMGPAVKTVSEMFDYVLPVGEMFAPGLSYGRAEVLSEPFGINWASFHRFFSKPEQTRDVDVSVSFSAGGGYVYGDLRERIVSLMEKLKGKWEGRYTIRIESGLSKEDYRDLLCRSKISLNVVGVNGPFNYRSCEIINSGSLLFQANTMEDGLSFSYDNVLEEGKHFVSFCTDDLEEKLLQYLEGNDLDEIAASASDYLRETHSYEKLFLSLLKKIPNSQLKRDLPDGTEHRDDFLLGTFLWHQHQEEGTKALGSALVGKSLSRCADETMFFANLLAVLPELLSTMGFDFLRQLVAKRNPSIAESLDAQSLQQIAIKFFSFKVDHVAAFYNFLTLSIEYEWTAIDILGQLAEQALVKKEWTDFSCDWFLRPCGKFASMDSFQFENFRYQNFHKPLLYTSNKGEEWIVYRDYLLSFFKVDSS